MPPCIDQEVVVCECLLELERFNEAEAVYTKLISNSSNPELAIESQYQLGWSQYKLGNREAAKITFMAGYFSR